MNKIINLFTITILLFFSSCGNAQKEKKNKIDKKEVQDSNLPIGLWKSSFKGGIIYVDINPKQVILKHLIEDVENRKTVYNFQSIKSYTYKKERKCTTNVKKDTAGAKEFRMGFVWNNKEEIWIAPFDLIVYSPKRYEKVIQFPQIDLSDKATVLTYLKKLNELYIAEINKTGGSTGFTLEQKTLTSLGYNPFPDYKKMRKDIKQFINDTEIRETVKTFHEWFIDEYKDWYFEGLK